MAAQPEEELADAIVEAEALAAIVEVADDNLDEDDEDIEGGDDLMADDEEIAADLPDEMTYKLDDDIPPYKSD